MQAGRNSAPYFLAVPIVDSKCLSEATESTATPSDKEMTSLACSLWGTFARSLVVVQRSSLTFSPFFSTSTTSTLLTVVPRVLP